jgi:hypothetical protein
MNRILFACLVLLLIAGASLAQTTDQSGLLCNLPREKAPIIRGARLGMTSEDIHSRFPGIASDYQASVEQAQRFPSFGAFDLSARPSETGKGQSFEGIEGIYFRLFDDHVVSYSVYYKGPNTIPRGPTWPRSDDLVARFAEPYHLPGAPNWAAEEGARILRCRGFEVRISGANGAQITVTDAGSTWVAEQKKRREAYEEQLRREFKP